MGKKEFKENQRTACRSYKLWYLGQWRGRNFLWSAHDSIGARRRNAGATRRVTAPLSSWLGPGTTGFSSLSPFLLPAISSPEAWQHYCLVRLMNSMRKIFKKNFGKKKKKEQNEVRFLYCSTQQQDLLEGKRRTRGPCGHLAALCTSQFCHPWSPGPTKLPTRVLRMRQRNLVKLRNCFKGSMTNGTQSTFGNESWSGSQA